MHLHHVTPLISPCVVRVAGKHGVPVVQTVHNYRHGCVNGLHLRDGHVCTDCVGTRLGLPGRAARVLSRLPAPDGAGGDRHGRPSPYLARRRGPLPRAHARSCATCSSPTGLPAERITVRPTWVPDPGAAGEPGRDVLYVGRLDEAKGDRPPARRLGAGASGGLHPRQRLVIAGDGPLAGPRSTRGRSTEDPTVARPGAAANGSPRRWPTRRTSWCPRASSRAIRSSVAEAFGRGRAVLTVSGGSVGTIVDDATGWVVDPSAEALAQALTAITVDDATSRGAGARASYERHNTPAAGLSSLLAVYEAVTG